MRKPYRKFPPPVTKFPMTRRRLAYVFAAFAVLLAVPLLVQLFFRVF